MTIKTVSCNTPCCKMTCSFDKGIVRGLHADAIALFAAHALQEGARLMLIEAEHLPLLREYSGESDLHSGTFTFYRLSALNLALIGTTYFPRITCCSSDSTQGYERLGNIIRRLTNVAGAVLIIKIGIETSAINPVAGACVISGGVCYAVMAVGTDDVFRKPATVAMTALSGLSSVLKFAGGCASTSLANAAGKIKSAWESYLNFCSG